MKRLLLAGVSLTVTACSMPSATPPSTASLSTSRSAPSQYLLSLAATPECTIWRDTGGVRICLDSATPEAAQPAAAASEPRRASRFEREPGQDFSDAAVANPTAGKASDQAKPVPVPAATAAKPARPADPAMPEIAAAPKRPATLFEEMQRIGMLDARLRVVGAPPRMAIAQADQAQIQGLPQLPTAAAGLPRLPVNTAGITTPPVVAPPGLPQLPKLAQGVISQAPGRAVEQAFAADPAAVPPPRATKSVATAATPSAGWKPVDGGRTQIAASDNMGRAPVAPVERAELPSVRADTVVPLKITEKATDQRPAVVAPAAIAPTKIAANPGAAPDLPPLPNLPQLPGASAAQPVPVALSAPPPPPVAQPVSKPVSQPVSKPLSQPVSKPVSKPVSQPVSKPVAKPVSGKLAKVAPSAAPVQPGGARYLVIHSFTDRQKAAQAAQKYGHLGATVATAQIQGQTWHRVVVRDGAAQRDRLNADGVRVYWPVSL